MTSGQKEPGFRRIEAEPVGLRPKVELKVRWSRTELKGWRDKVQPKARKSCGVGSDD